jgi:putative ABC transport system permease protein
LIRFLSLKSLNSRKLISFLCILSIALSLALLLLVERIRNVIQEGFTNSISNADLIVGARSGPLQLLLYTVFHMGSATNNIRYSTYKEVSEHPSVSWTIPISLGDSYKGHRVVATNHNFFKYYQFREDKSLKLAQGKWFSGVYEVVLGSQVARKQKLHLQQKIILSHGVSKVSVLAHENSPFQISGILEGTGTPIDKSIFISLHGMEAIHMNEKPKALKKDDLEISQITSFILRTKNRFALLHLNRWISQYDKEPIMGIIPAMTLAELWGMLDQLEKAFLGVSLFVIVIGFISVLISLYMSLNERQREMAILRSVGVSAKKITLLLITEATMLSLIGGLCGFVIQYIIAWSINPFLQAYYSFSIPVGRPTGEEALIIGVFILLGPLSGLIPAIKAYKTSLHNGLLIK